MQADEIQIREVLSLAVWFSCCWEMTQGVEGSEKAPEQLTVFYFPAKFTKRQRNPTSVESTITLCLCLFSSEYHVDDPPRLVLDKLEKIGFRVLTMTGVGQTLVWCLHKHTEWSESLMYQNTFICLEKRRIMMNFFFYCWFPHLHLAHWQQLHQALVTWKKILKLRLSQI